VSLVRRVLSAHWVASADEPGLLEFRISATAFCHQMVRSIVGLLVDVGRGHRPPGDVAAAIQARDRSRAGQLAPPHGLVLWEVGY
jgi:tRNA pseudouridine38-40 synthase